MQHTLLSSRYLPENPGAVRLGLHNPLLGLVHQFRQRVSEFTHSMRVHFTICAAIRYLYQACKTNAVSGVPIGVAVRQPSSALHAAYVRVD